MITLTYGLHSKPSTSRGLQLFIFTEIHTKEEIIVSVSNDELFTKGVAVARDKLFKLFAKQVAKKKFKELIKQPYLILIGPETKIDITHMVAFHIANLILQGESV